LDIKKKLSAMKRLVQSFTRTPPNSTKSTSVLTAGAVISLLAFSSADVRGRQTRFFFSSQIIFFF
jgi:hypothetical protein